MSVYYVHAPETGLVKIGFAKEPAGRLCKMQVDSPTRLILLAVEPGDKCAERARHKQFASLRARGEWFSFGPELKAFVATLPPYVRPPSNRGPLPGPLGAWLRRNDHTLASFADLVGTTDVTIHRVCSGTVPRRDLMTKIVQATDWEIDANTLCGVPPKPATDKAA